MRSASYREGSSGMPVDGVRLLNSRPALVRIAAFDVDGTIIEGQSGAHLIRYLIKHKHVSPWLGARVAFWAFCYRQGVPLDYRKILREILRGFAGTSLNETAQDLRLFVAEELVRHIRPQALEAMHAHQDQGECVLLASASVAPLIGELAAHLPVDGWIATALQVEPDGTFQGEIDGQVLTGAAKRDALQAYADARFPRWHLAHAYADHESDLAFLAASERAIVVNPSRGLQRHARVAGWPVVSWAPPGRSPAAV